MGSGILSRYRDHLPLTLDTPLLSLGEGDTPLVRARQLANLVGCAELYLKLEGCNPTGSFKDRGMVLAVAKAMENGSSSIICASTGNTSASAAAYGAYCGLNTIVLVPKGDVSKAKLAQAMAYGARIFTVQGRFDQALEIVRELTDRHRISLVNSVNPYRLEGQKTAAFEIVDELGQAPDLLCIPVGNAGNITAYWKGFVEYEQIGKSTHLPRMMGFQAEGAAPIVRGVAVADPRTVASAIRIGNPASWNGALKARDESDGVIDSVSDEEILNAYRLLAQKEGVFCEPASAASLAGLLKLSQNGVSLVGKQVVCVITGSGLKDTDLAVQTFTGELQEVGASLLEVEEALLVSGIENQIR